MHEQVSLLAGVKRIDITDVGLTVLVEHGHSPEPVTALAIGSGSAQSVRIRAPDMVGSSRPSPPPPAPIRDGLRAAVATARLDLLQFNRTRVIVLLAVLEAITFLVLVNLFGLTGSRAPTAIVNDDHGPLATAFQKELKRAHHSFALRPMSAGAARSAISTGGVVSIITIPQGFSSAISAGHTVVLPITVDNLDADLTDDIREAVPSAIMTFGRDQRFPGVRVVSGERDVVDHETGSVPYLVVSALVLDALVVAGILGALAVTREYEGRTVVQ